MKGVDWDTTGLPAGPYVVQGYTWEPPFNIYWPRPGVLHIVDGPGLDAINPAMAMTSRENVVDRQPWQTFGREDIAGVQVTV